MLLSILILLAADASASEAATQTPPAAETPSAAEAPVTMAGPSAEGADSPTDPSVAPPEPSDTSQPDRDELARQYYQSAERLYASGQYDAAIDGFLRAYDMSQRPQLLFNLANAYERDGRYAEAADALQRFRDLAAKPVDRPAIDLRIQSLQERAELRQLEEEELQALRAFKRDTDSSRLALEQGGSEWSWLPWLVGAVGATLVGSAVVLGLLSDGAGVDAASFCQPRNGQTLCLASAEPELDQEKGFAIAADLALGFGLTALGGAGIIWFVQSDTMNAGDQTGTTAMIGVRGEF